MKTLTVTKMSHDSCNVTIQCRKSRETFLESIWYQVGDDVRVVYWYTCDIPFVQKMWNDETGEEVWKDVCDHLFTTNLRNFDMPKLLPALDQISREDFDERNWNDE